MAGDNRHNSRRQIREARLDIVGEFYKRGYSIRQIRNEVIKALNKSSCSTETIHKDIQLLLKEWREARITDMDKAVTLELERIDDTIRELWAQWEKSKKDYEQNGYRKRGFPNKKEGNITTIEIEERNNSIVALGDVSYITEIRKQLIERRKLLGLYAPEKREVKSYDFDMSILTDEQRKVLLEAGEAILNGETD